MTESVSASDIKKQVNSVCESLYAQGLELKKITGRLVAKDAGFSHTTVTPFVKEWREQQYKAEAEELKKTSMSEVLVRALHQEINTRMHSLNNLRDSEMEANRKELTEALDSVAELTKTLGQLEIKLKDASDANLQLERDLAGKTQEVSTLGATVSRMESEVTRLTEDLERKETEWDAELKSLTAAHESKLESLTMKHEGDLSQLESRHSETVKDLKAEHTQRIAELSSTHSDAVTELKEAHLSSQQQQEAELTKVKSDLRDVTAESSEKSETIGQLKAELEDKEQIKARMASVETQNRELEIKLSSAQQSAKTASETLGKLEVEIQDHKDQRNSAQRELSTLNNKYSKLSEDHTQLLVENANLKGKVQSLSTTVQGSE